MTTSKKSRSRPAAKKAVRKPQLLAPELARSLPNWIMFDRQLIDSIAARVNVLESQLKRIDPKLDILLVRAAPLNREEWHPLIEQAAQALENE